LSSLPLIPKTGGPADIFSIASRKKSEVFRELVDGLTRIELALTSLGNASQFLNCKKMLASMGWFMVLLEMNDISISLKIALLRKVAPPFD